MQAVTKLRLLVLEHGADLPAFSRSEPIGDLVIVPDAPERPADLALGVIRRIARAERQNCHIQEATIAVSGAGGSQRSAARALLARELARHQLQAGGGEIVLWARGSATAETRHDILALAGVLMSELRSTRVSLRVLFEPDSAGFACAEGDPPSGIHAKYESTEGPSWAVSGGEAS